jgi:prepilin-type N-terminal cleavage/methylation domain-containing protein
VPEERSNFVAWRKADFPRAFTLVELLVVIAIIAMLAAMILPALGKARESSRATLCAGHMHQIVVAALVYDSDNKRLPSMMEWLYRNPPHPIPAPLDTPSDKDLTQGLLYPYLQSTAVYCCPSESGSVPNGGIIDHSYQVSCNTCHAHDASECLAPARTVYFLEATNLSRGMESGLATSTATNLAFRHTKREHLVFMDAHFEKLTGAQFTNASVGDPRFWYPNNIVGMFGNP